MPQNTPCHALEGAHLDPPPYTGIGFEAATPLFHDDQYIFDAVHYIMLVTHVNVSVFTSKIKYAIMPIVSEGIQ